MDSKRENGITLIIVAILIIVMLLLVGIVAYLLYDSKNVNNIQQNEITAITDVIVKEEKQVEVIEGINYTVTCLSKDRVIKIPQIINGGENAVMLNKEIASETLKETYNMTDLNFEIGLTTSYDYKIKNNILVIETNITYDDWPASGDGIFTHTFFYDIENDKILEMDEALELLDYTVNDDEEFDLTNIK